MYVLTQTTQADLKKYTLVIDLVWLMVNTF